MTGLPGDRGDAPPEAAPERPAEGTGLLWLNLMAAAELWKRAGEIQLRHAEAGHTSALGQEMLSYGATLGRVASYWMSDPARLVEAQRRLIGGLGTVMAAALLRLQRASPAEVEAPLTADARFADPQWRTSPYYAAIRQGYEVLVAWAERLLTEVPDLDDATRRLARLQLNQITAALSPANFVLTNPELLSETLSEHGANLVRGGRMLVEDLEAGHGMLKIRHADSSRFELGVNIATTPGKVVYRNDLIELIQYAPTTPWVRRRPLLLVPSWINKFYILDLTAEKSLIRWAVAEVLTVLVVSWVNPDERHSAKGFDAYLTEGLFSALTAVERATGERRVDVVGYCVGGTLAAAAAAHEAATGAGRIASLTLLAAQVDFSEAGDLKALFDENKVRALEDRMYARGYLEGAEMASAFNALRPNDLIWSSIVNVYLKGQPPPAFDLLHWNSDSTRIPATNHAFYLRSCYLENRLAEGRMELAGERLDLGRVDVPVFALAAREDHIAPARSVFRGAQRFGGPVSFVLAGSGHIAGVVNPPARQKYDHAVGPAPAGALDDWLRAAAIRPGSWWQHWRGWLAGLESDQVPARQPDAAALADAPGAYVRVVA